MPLNKYSMSQESIVERSNQDTPSKEWPIITFLFVSVIIFMVCGVIANIVLNNDAHKNSINRANVLIEKFIGENICPISNAFLSEKVCGNMEDTQEIKRKLAQVDSISTAMSVLKWKGNNEQDAVKFAVLVNAITKGGWYRYDSEEPWSITRDVLQPLWVDYPQIIFSSRCYLCMHHASNFYEWFSATPDLHNDFLLDVASIASHQLGNLHNRLGIKDEKLLSLIRIHSRLAFVGDREYFHAKILRQNRDYRHTLALIRNTSSAAPFWEIDLNSVPQNLLKLSWEQGVRNFDDHPVFTGHLVSTGHKPALRWLVWMLEEVDYFPRLRKMQRLKSHYQGILDQYTEGVANANTYSQKWNEIVWDEKKKKWIF